MGTMTVAWVPRLVSLSFQNSGEFTTMAKNLARGIIGLVLTAAATWLTNRIVDQMFGPDDPDALRG